MPAFLYGISPKQPGMRMVTARGQRVWRVQHTGDTRHTTDKVKLCFWPGRREAMSGQVVQGENREDTWTFQSRIERRDVSLSRKTQGIWCGGVQPRCRPQQRPESVMSPQGCEPRSSQWCKHQPPPWGWAREGFSHCRPPSLSQQPIPAVSSPFKLNKCLPFPTPHLLHASSLLSPAEHHLGASIWRAAPAVPQHPPAKRSWTDVPWHAWRAAQTPGGGTSLQAGPLSDSTVLNSQR